MDSQVREIQLIQLDLMKKMHTVCEKNNLTYVMIGGTLLGAVRHQGFIPWDDDLDIALPRKDYDKLIDILEKEPIDGCFLQNFDTDRHYLQPYAKLRKNGTIFLERYCKNVKMHHGVFIDIFPLDSVARSESIITLLREYMAEEIVFAIWKNENSPMNRYGWKKVEELISGILGLLPKATLIDIYKKLIIRTNEHDEYYIHNSVGYIRKKVYFRKYEIEERELLKFETERFYAPRNWDQILINLFGDYMKYPPMKDRNSGHDVIKVELHCGANCESKQC